jgi:RNA polymerase sigma-70 factor (ECF subfamily)
MTNKAIASLLKQHHEDAYRWSYQCCRGNEDNAKDVLQLAYLKIVEGKAKYQEKSAFKTWLFSVIRFTAIDYFKQDRKLMTLDGIELADE